MDTVVENITGDRAEVLKYGIIAAETALGRSDSCCVSIPISSPLPGGPKGIVIGIDMHHVPKDIQDLVIALAVKLGLDPGSAEKLRPSEKTADEVSYTLVG
jgi:hypothetical protein